MPEWADGGQLQRQLVEVQTTCVLLVFKSVEEGSRLLWKTTWRNLEIVVIEAFGCSSSFPTWESDSH